MQTFTESKPTNLRVLRFPGGRKKVRKTIDAEKEREIHVLTESLQADPFWSVYHLQLLREVVRRISQSSESPDPFWAS